MAAIRYVDCNLTILDEQRTKYHDTFRRTPIPGDVGGAQESLAKDTIERLHRWVASEDPYIEREDLEVLGRHLYCFLFDANIRKAFEESYQGFRSTFEKNARLRLVLAFHEEAKELASYPWEFLFMPKRDKEAGFFVCAEKRTELILTRFVPDSTPDDTLRPEEADLKILVAFANP